MTFERCQGPRAGELLAVLTLIAPTYKYLRRSNGETRLVPSYLPDSLSPSLSLWFVDTCNAGEVLDAKRATAFDHPGASHRWESVEETHRSRTRPSPSSSSSSTHAPVTIVVFSARR
jgi:hypothetical protein